MSLAKWNKKDLMQMKELGYSILKCDSEQDALKHMSKLRMSKRCAQAGRIKNSNDEDVFFVCTKERAVNGGRI